MEKFIRQCAGIDVSKDTLDVALSILTEGFQVRVLSSAQFANSKKGIMQLSNWLAKNRQQDLDLKLVLEATGVYHEKATYGLDEMGYDITVAMPNKVSSYCRSTDVRTVNDKISARQIAEFGLMKKLDRWQRPDACLQMLKVLCREREQLIAERAAVKSQKHATAHAEGDNLASLKRLSVRIKFMDKQVAEIEKEISQVVKENPELKRQLDNICTIKGVGFITAVTIVAETDGFNLIRNAKQLVCFAGYDVVHKESGISVKSKGKISRMGNKHIRRALYFPALSTVTHDMYFSGFYERLFDRQKIKMKAYVAVQRKLLVLIYTLWKNGQAYDSQKGKIVKYLGQPIGTALTELDQVRP